MVKRNAASVNGTELIHTCKLHPWKNSKFVVTKSGEAFDGSLRRVEVEDNYSTVAMGFMVDNHTLALRWLSRIPGYNIPPSSLRILQ